MVGKQTSKLAFIGIIFAFSLAVSCCYLNLGPWKRVTVSRRACSFSSLAVVNGCPAISYFETSGFNKTRREHLRYIRARDANGSSWGSPITVVSARSLSEHHTLAVINGHPAISYYDASGKAHAPLVKYVYALDVDGASWGSPITVASASDVSIETRVPLAVVNGHPAIVYPGIALAPWKDWRTGKPQEWDNALKYIRAKDADGRFWGNPVTLRGGRHPFGFMLEGRHVSLEVVNGCPAISYYDPRGEGIPGEIMYVRASNANGSSWGNPITVASTGDYGGEPSLAVVNGYPAISYHYCAKVNAGLVSLLKYVRASNANGSSWERPVPVADSGGTHSSLEVVNGYPAISYWSNGSLKYVCASDADGSSWGSPLILPSNGVPDWYTSLASVNGRPAISFQCERKLAGSFLNFAILTERGDRATADR